MEIKDDFLMQTQFLPHSYTHILFVFTHFSLTLREALQV